MIVEYVDAVRTLADSQNSSAEQKVNVLSHLENAPSEYEHGLLYGLADPNDTVWQRACEVSLRRFQRLNDAEQVAFFEKLLQFCFSDGRASTEPARTRLVAEICLHLQRSKNEAGHHLQYDPLVTYLIARSRDLLTFPQDSQTFAATVLKQIWQFSRGERSDHDVVNKVDFERRLVVFGTPTTAIETVRGYLIRDADFELADLSYTTFAAYGKLLAVHSRAERGNLIVDALKNIDKWLDKLPNTTERYHYYREDVRQARRGVAWESFDHPLQLQLAAHTELLNSDKEDLIYLLINRFRYWGEVEEQEITECCLSVLSRLVGVRRRIPKELLPFLREQLMERSNWAFETKKKALEMLAALAVGLPETLPAPPHGDEESSESRDQRREWEKLQRRRSTLIRNVDRPIRQFLEQICEDEVNYELPVRIASWRTLLGLTPRYEERQQLYQRGLSDVDHWRFAPTLELAEETHFRGIWSLIAPHWAALTEHNADSETRRARLELVCTVLSKLRIIAPFTRRNGNFPPPIIVLVLDDPDETVKALARGAVYRAGYGVELEREELRRTILTLTDELERVTQQISELERARDELKHNIREGQSQNQDVAAQIEFGFQKRERLLTDSWLETIRLQTSILKIQTELEDATRDVSNRMPQLEQLHIQVQQQHEAYRQQIKQVNNLIGKVRNRDGDIARLYKRIDNHQKQIAANVQKIAGWERQQRNLRRTVSNLLQQAQSTGSDVNRQLADRRRRLKRLGDRVNNTEANSIELQRKIRNTHTQIPELEREIREIDTEIRKQRIVLERMTAKRQSIERDYNRDKSVFDELYQRIERLQHRALDLQRSQAKDEFEITQNLANLDKKRTSLQGQLRSLERTMQQYAVNLNQLTTQWNQRHTEQQKIIGELERNRSVLTQKNKRAQIDSPHSNALGEAKWLAHDATKQDEQTSLIFHAEGIRLAATDKRARQRG